MCLIRQRTIFFRFYIFSNFRFNFIKHLIGIFLIHCRLITEPVILGILDALSRITFLHNHDHVIRLVGGSANFLKYIIRLHHSHADHRQYDRHQETDDHPRIAQHLILRILKNMCRTKEYCQCPDQEDQVLLRQHPAACHSHDADHRYQKLDQCDQFSYQVLSFHFQKSLSHIIHPSSVTVQSV